LFLRVWGSPVILRDQLPHQVPIFSGLFCFLWVRGLSRNPTGSTPKSSPDYFGTFFMPFTLEKRRFLAEVRGFSRNSTGLTPTSSPEIFVIFFIAFFQIKAVGMVSRLRGLPVILRDQLPLGYQALTR
jgi:hypothetical protein